MKKKWILIIGGVVLIVLIAGAMVGPIMSKVEHPDYDVITSTKNIETRQYAPMLIAKVNVEGERKEAINQGFRLLADYIFGNNAVAQSIAMTAPVQQQNSKKIAMTAPVQQQGVNGTWQISFVMPSEYSIDTIPKPNNQQVMLEEIPAEKYLVIRFSGSNTKTNIAEHEAQLTQYIKDNQIQVAGLFKYAFYNPPWTLPFLRRNEIMVKID